MGKDEASFVPDATRLPDRSSPPGLAGAASAGASEARRSRWGPIPEPPVAIELDSVRRLRTRNKGYYRVLHWPIWIFVFFIAPGPLTFDLFDRGFNPIIGLWLGLVVAGTGWAAIRGRLPGVEPRPYIIRFTEDRPNPLYRRICYTLAWSEMITFGVLNLAGLVVAVANGTWMLEEIYRYCYFPLAGSIWALGLFGRLPRVKPSTRGEGHERRYFYGTAWAVCIAQPVLWILWGALPRSRPMDGVKLVVFFGILVIVGLLARRGSLPRTRCIVPGDWAIG